MSPKSEGGFMPTLFVAIFPFFNIKSENFETLFFGHFFRNSRSRWFCKKMSPKSEGGFMPALFVAIFPFFNFNFLTFFAFFCRHFLVWVASKLFLGKKQFVIFFRNPGKKQILPKSSESVPCKLFRGKKYGTFAPPFRIY